VKVLSDDFETHLKSGATTLATCWILRREDGLTLGFTDHDRNLLLDGVVCEPVSGMTGTEMRQSAGFDADDQEVAGALTSDRLTETDLLAGRYDGAKVETWRVNWADPTQKVHLKTGYMGEIRRTDQAFEAEIRGFSAAMEQRQGRIYQYGCDAQLGDAHCRVDLTAEGRQTEATVLAILSQTEMQLQTDQDIEAGHLARGAIEVLSGEASALRYDILSHTKDGDKVILESWLPLHAGLATGDRVRLTVGCDKQFATCRKRFANGLNFRGFPHIPGNDFLLTYPKQGVGGAGNPIVEDEE